MEERTCGCRKWQMVGIPCVHAACVIIGKREKVEDYVSEYYTKIRWRETYRDGINPVQGMPLWPRMNRLPVLPPPWRPGKRGRPNNHARRKRRNESSSSSTKTKMSRDNRVVTCSNCMEEGHNKKRCKNATVLPPPKKARGRPRKNQEPQVLESHPGASHLESQGQRFGSQSHQGSQRQGQGSQAHGTSQGSGAHGASQGPHAQSQSQEQQGVHGFASWFECSN